MRVRDVLLEAQSVVGVNDALHQLRVGEELVLAVAAQALACGRDMHERALWIQPVLPNVSRVGAVRSRRGFAALRAAAARR